MTCPRCDMPLTHPTEIRDNLCGWFQVEGENDARQLAEARLRITWWELDLATQDMLTSRQQTEMAGDM